MNLGDIQKKICQESWYIFGVLVVVVVRFFEHFVIFGTAAFFYVGTFCTEA